MTTLKRKATGISTTTYPCDSLPDELQDYILSFLPNHDILSLKVLSKQCHEKFDGPYYWRMMTLHMLHDKARARKPTLLSDITEEEIDGWDSERLVEECEKIEFRLRDDKPEQVLRDGVITMKQQWPCPTS